MKKTIILITMLLIIACGGESKDNTSQDNDSVGNDTNTHVDKDELTTDDSDKSQDEDFTQTDPDQTQSDTDITPQAECPDNNKFCKEFGGLKWSALSNKMIMEDAEKYCQSIGGRLPTLSELRSIIKNCERTVTGGECQASDTCDGYADCWTDVCSGCSDEKDGRYSQFGDIETLWSSTTVNNYENWVIMFENAGIGAAYHEFAGGNPFRCVKN